MSVRLQFYLPMRIVDLSWLCHLYSMFHWKCSVQCCVVFQILWQILQALSRGYQGRVDWPTGHSSPLWPLVLPQMPHMPAMHCSSWVCHIPYSLWWQTSPTVGVAASYTSLFNDINCAVVTHLHCCESFKNLAAGLQSHWTASIVIEWTKIGKTKKMTMFIVANRD